jgi:hypothetical protein
VLMAFLLNIQRPKQLTPDKKYQDKAEIGFCLHFCPSS